MARLIYSDVALTDLERLTDLLLQQNPSVASETVDLIIEAVELLENHPLIGHPVEAGLRALVISYGRSGYVALYAVEQNRDAVLILSVRHRRDAGYRN